MPQKNEHPEIQESSEGKNLDNESLENLFKEFCKTLEIPKNKEKTQFIVSTIGLIGSGKTTILKRLCEQFHLVRISNDEVRKLLTINRFNLLRTKEISQKVILKFLNEGHSLAIDADAASLSVQEKLKAITKQFDCALIWLHIATPEEEILKRLDQNNLEREYRGKNAIAHYYKRKVLHENINLEFNYVFNKEKMDLNTQILEATKKIKESLS